MLPLSMKLLQAGDRSIFQMMKSCLGRIAITSTALLVASCGDKERSAKEGEREKALVITAIPDEKVSDQEANYKALQEYLAKELDIEVKFSISSSYPAAVERFKNGEVHLAWFGGYTGVQARSAVPGARAIAQGDVDPKYKSYMIANKETGLTKSDEFPS